MDHFENPSFSADFQWTTEQIKREEFTKVAMAALITAITRMSEKGIITNGPQDVAELAILYADATLTALSKKPQP